MEIENNQFSRFFVPLHVFEAISADLKLSLSQDAQGVRLKPEFKSPKKIRIKKLISQYPSIHYIKSEKSFAIPVEILKDFIQASDEKKIELCVEESLGRLLKQTSSLRTQIVEGQCEASLDELSACLLYPALDFEGNSFQLHGATTAQLRALLPESLSHTERTALSKGLSIESALLAQTSAELKQIPLWLTASAKQKFANWKNQFKIDENTLPFSHLCIHQPNLCLVQLPSDQCALLIHSKLLETMSPDLHAVVKPLDHLDFPISKEHTLISIPSTRLDSIREQIESNFKDEVLYLTDTFVSYLKKREGQNKVSSRRLAYEEMKDTSLELAIPELSGKLFPHQRIAVKWLLETPRAFLGDDMGLGKTLSVLATYAELVEQDESNFLLVVCPNSLTQNWMREAETWVPHLDFRALPDTKRRRERLIQKMCNPNYIGGRALVLHYEALRIPYMFPLIRDLCECKRTVLCVDESQRAKNPMSKTFQALRHVSEVCPRRILLSGTPTPRDVSDVWSQMHLLDDGERFGSNFYKWLSSVAELGTRYSKYAVRSFKPDAVEDTISRVREILLRRKKEQVVSLPPKLFSTRNVKLSADQAKRYDEVRKDLLVRLSNTDGETFVKELDSILEQYLRAVQIASNPRIVDENWKGEPAKFLELDQIIDEVVTEHGRKIVVWTNFRKNVDELVERYEHLGSAEYSGDVSTEDRDEIVQKFQDKDDTSIRVLIAIPAAGGVGITLTAAQTAVYVDKTWNGEHWLQSIDRIHRIGQEGTVHVISLNGSKVDSLISGNLKKKEKLIKKVLGDTDGDFDLESAPNKEEIIESLQNESPE